MKKEEWNQGLNHLDSGLVEEYVKKKETLAKRRAARALWMRMGVIAACVCVLVSSVLVVPMLSRQMPGGEPEQSTEDSTVEDTSTEDSSEQLIAPPRFPKFNDEELQFFSGINLFVGRGNEACKSGFSGDHAEAVKESKFGIYRNNNDFLFIGFDTAKGNVYAANDSCGTLLAVEYFAQKYLQSKFFLPGKDGVKYVLNPLLNFTAASDVPQASYEVRGFQSGAKDVDRKDFMLFYRRRLGQVPRWSTRNCNYMFIKGHTSRDVVPRGPVARASVGQTQSPRFREH